MCVLCMSTMQPLLGLHLFTNAIKPLGTPRANFLTYISIIYVHICAYLYIIYSNYIRIPLACCTLSYCRLRNALCLPSL